MRGEDLRPSTRYDDKSTIQATPAYMTKRAKGKLFILLAKSNCCDMSYFSIRAGLASQCQSGGVEDGQGWLPVHWAGRGGDIFIIKTIEIGNDERTFELKGHYV